MPPFGSTRGSGFSSRSSAPVWLPKHGSDDLGPLSRTVSIPLNLEVDTSLSGLAQQLDANNSAETPHFTRTYESVHFAMLHQDPDKPAQAPQPALPALPELPARPTRAPGLGQRISVAFKTLQTTIFPNRTRLQPIVEKDALVEDLTRQLKGKSLVSLPTFEVALDLRGRAFAEKLFHVIDKDNTGSVSTEQLVTHLLGLQNGSLEDRIAFTFSVVSGGSKNQDVTFQQLIEVLQASCTEGNVKIHESYLQGMAGAIFAKAGKRPEQNLTLDDFTRVLRDRPEVKQAMKLAGLKVSSRRDKEAEENESFRHLSWPDRMAATASQRLRVRGITNFKFVLWLVLIFYAQLAGFGTEFAAQVGSAGFNLMGWTYPVAKAAAEAMKVILVLFFFTVSRNLLTYLRTTPLQYVIPFDEALKMHRHLAYHFFFWAWLHTIAHLVNASRATDPANAAWWPRYGNSFRPPIPVQPTTSVFYQLPVEITGLALTGIMTVGYFFASPWPRRAPWFQSLLCAKWVNDFSVFYLTHVAMTISLVVLLICHPVPGRMNNDHHSTTWAYMLAGLIAYLSGNCIQYFRNALFTCYVQDVKVYSGRITQLKLSLPKWKHGGFGSFNYAPGQYAQLRIRQLSRIEWHPFTISSAPCDDFIMFHIAAQGDWTTKLFELCSQRAWLSQEKQQHSSENGFAEEEGTAWLNPSGAFTVDLNGPYGAPAQDYRSYSVLLLVGAGICVTPFASILRQLMFEHNQSKCEHCNKVNHRLFAPKKVYFYWVVRDQTAPQYMQQLLQDIKQEDVQNFLEINIHITSTNIQSNDIRHIFTLVGQSIQHEVEGFDPVTGVYVPTPCYFARPDWKGVMNKISLSHRGERVGVFVCGPSTLAGQLKGLCNLRNEQSRSDPNAAKYVFHKETF